GTGAGNVISGNTVFGIQLDSTAGNGTTIQGNVIGLNAAGNAAVGNVSAGLVFNAGFSTLIGGTNSQARNVISGNIIGINVSSAGTNYGLLIQGNYVGTDITGTTALSTNATGISLASAPGDVVGGTATGAGNVISGNRTGVAIAGITHPVI